MRLRREGPFALPISQFAIGVDGCRGGWVAAILQPEQPLLEFRYFTTLAAITAAWPRSSICVDMPIGLAESAPRACDREARRMVGPRRSSVFPAPDRRLIDATSYDDARALAAKLSIPCPSKQAYFLLPKIREADALITPRRQRRIVESHPEVSFTAANGRQPMEFRKATPEGYRERRRVLRHVLPDCRMPLRRTTARLLAPNAKPDDILDAAILAWTAARHADGRAERLPAAPRRDARGLRMEIVY